MKDVLGQAISDYFHQTSAGKLWVNNKYGPREEMPVAVYFRNAEEMPELEWIAVQHCKGKILDIGAGAGSHTLLLQQMGQDCTALEISPLAAAVIKARGVERIIQKDFFQWTGETYDTLLLMMNGIGLSGTLRGLRAFLGKARKLLSPGGQLIFDSSNIAYLYGGHPPEMPDYYGEILYQYEYKKQRSDWFNWLFIDGETLKTVAAEEGWQTEFLFTDESDQFLAKCQLI